MIFTIANGRQFGSVAVGKLASLRVEGTRKRAFVIIPTDQRLRRMPIETIAAKPARLYASSVCPNAIYPRIAENTIPA